MRPLQQFISTYPSVRSRLTHPLTGPTKDSGIAGKWDFINDLARTGAWGHLQQAAYLLARRSPIGWVTTGLQSSWHLLQLFWPLTSCLPKDSPLQWPSSLTLEMNKCLVLTLEAVPVIYFPCAYNINLRIHCYAGFFVKQSLVFQRN